MDLCKSLRSPVHPKWTKIVSFRRPTTSHRVSVDVRPVTVLTCKLLRTWRPEDGGRKPAFCRRARRRARHRPGRLEPVRTAVTRRHATGSRVFLWPFNISTRANLFILSVGVTPCDRTALSKMKEVSAIRADPALSDHCGRCSVSCRPARASWRSSPRRRRRLQWPPAARRDPAAAPATCAPRRPPARRSTRPA